LLPLALTRSSYILAYQILWNDHGMAVDALWLTRPMLSIQILFTNYDIITDVLNLVFCSKHFIRIKTFNINKNSILTAWFVWFIYLFCSQSWVMIVIIRIKWFLNKGRSPHFLYHRILILEFSFKFISIEKNWNGYRFANFLLK
jgi:hypothetical protein